jgi:hypothetical protein
MSVYTWVYHHDKIKRIEACFSSDHLTNAYAGATQRLQKLIYLSTFQHASLKNLIEKLYRDKDLKTNLEYAFFTRYDDGIDQIIYIGHTSLIENTRDR